MSEAELRSDSSIELAHARLWSVVAVLAGLAGVGIGLSSITSNTTKALVPVVVAAIAVVIGVAAAYSAPGARPRWLPVRATKRDAPPSAGVARIGEGLAAHRTDALSSVSGAWVDA